MEPGQLTLLMNRAETDPAARDQLMLLLTPDLLRIAHLILTSGKRDPALDTVALVNDAYIKLFGQPPDDREANDRHWVNRRHFMHCYARVMRQLRTDCARRLRSISLEGSWVEDRSGAPVGKELEEAELLVALDEALTQLAQSDKQAALVFELRFYGESDDPAEKVPADRLLPISAVVRQLGWSRYAVDTAWERACRYLHGRLPKLGLADKEGV